MKKECDLTDVRANAHSDMFTRLRELFNAELAVIPRDLNASTHTSHIPSIKPNWSQTNDRKSTSYDASASDQRKKIIFLYIVFVSVCQSVFAYSICWSWWTIEITWKKTITPNWKCVCRTIWFDKCDRYRLMSTHLWNTHSQSHSHTKAIE